MTFYPVSVMGRCGEMTDLADRGRAACGCSGTWFLRWWDNLVRWDLLCVDHRCADGQVTS